MILKMSLQVKGMVGNFVCVCVCWCVRVKCGRQTGQNGRLYRALKRGR